MADHHRPVFQQQPQDTPQSFNGNLNRSCVNVVSNMAFNRRRQPQQRDPYWFAGAESHSIHEGLWTHQLPSPTGSTPRAPLSLPKAVSVCSDLADSVESFGAPSSVASTSRSSKRSYWFAQSGSDVADCLRHQEPVAGHALTNSSNQNQIQAQVGQSGQQQQLSQADWGSSSSQPQDPYHVERVRQEARERQEELHRRRLEELVHHNENAQRIREEGDHDKKRNYQERQALHEIHKQQVDERRRALHEADQEWREAVMRRSQERDLRAEQYRKNRLSASILIEGTQAQSPSVMSSPARGASDRRDENEPEEDKVTPLPSAKPQLMTASCFGSLWGPGALVQEDGDLMSRSMIVTSSAARRKTDLTPVTPSPWARGLGSKALPTPSRPQTAAGSAGTPKRAVSMSRLDILAQPRRRFTMEDLKSHQSASASRSEQVSPTHHLSAPHHLRSRSQMSSDLSQSSVASSVGSPHANLRPKMQGSANRKTRPLSIAGSIPSSELDKKEKAPLRKPQKPVPPASSPEPQTFARPRRSASPKKKEASPQKEIRESAIENATNNIETASAINMDIPLLMTQSFTEGCMPIENRPAETRKAKTREEAMAEIAEARKKAREELEKQAEEERKKKEEEAAARKAIQEKRRQLEEEARLKKEKEEEEKRLAEEEAKKAEEERLRQEEEQKRVEEEKAKLEAIERQKKEEQDRLERKKRVEEIMARTRKARGGTDPKDVDGQQQRQQQQHQAPSESDSANVSPVRSTENTGATKNNAQNGLLNGHSANNVAPSVGGGGDNVNVIEKKNEVATDKKIEDLISIDNSNNGPSSTDSGTGSADFNSNNTQQHTTTMSNNNISANSQVTRQTPTTTTTESSLVAQEAPLIQDLLS